MTTLIVPKTRRDVWLSVALAVAQGLPATKHMRLHDASDPDWVRAGGDGSLASLDLSTHAEARQWAAHLDLLDSASTQTHPDGDRGLYYSGVRDGWSWSISAIEPSEPSTSELAAQVVAAILTPDASNLPRTAEVVDLDRTAEVANAEAASPLSDQTGGGS
jgi:hypothetical protein